jgi:hypothetical protein
MISSSIRAFPSLLLACGMTANAATGVDPQDLRPAAELPPIDIVRPVVANYTDVRDMALRLGQGRYLPVAQDEGGIYYACPFGVVLHTGGAADWTFNRLIGGVYVPGPSAQQPQRKIWFSIAGGAGATGRLKVSPDIGSRLAQHCDGQATDVVQSTSGGVNFVVTPVGDKAAAMVGPAAAGAQISSAIINSVLSRNDGRYFFPPVTLEAPIEIKAPAP